jgi:hypothetical protein
MHPIRPTNQTKGIMEAHLSNHTRHSGPTLNPTITAKEQQKETHQSQIPPNDAQSPDAGPDFPRDFDCAN